MIDPTTNTFSHRNFNATIFEVHLGASDFKFHVHENFLKKSPTLVEKVKEAKQKPRRADNQILYLDEHDPGAFEQAVQYLYMDKFKLIKQNTNLGRLRELHELMALAKILQLRPLQKQVVATFAKSNLINKISIWTFFDWAEDMYYEEIDFQKGPFQKYFAHNAPDLLKNSFLGRERVVQAQVIDEPPHELRDKIMLQVKSGGAYAMEMFSIMHDVCWLNVYACAAMNVARTSGTNDATCRLFAASRPKSSSRTMSRRLRVWQIARKFSRKNLTRSLGFLVSHDPTLNEEGDRGGQLLAFLDQNSSNIFFS